MLYYHQLKVWLTCSVVGCIALVGCNTQGAYLGVTGVEAEDPESSFTGSAHTSLGSNDSSGNDTGSNEKLERDSASSISSNSHEYDTSSDEGVTASSVESNAYAYDASSDEEVEQDSASSISSSSHGDDASSDEEAEQGMERLQRQLNEKSECLERKVSEVNNIRVMATTLASEAMRSRRGAEMREKDTSGVVGEIAEDLAQSQCARLEISCKTCGNNTTCSPAMLVSLLERYPTHLFRRMRTDYKYFIFNAWSWNHKTYVTSRAFAQCFKCMNENKAKEFLNQLEKHEDALRKLSEEIESGESKIESLTSEKTDATRNLRAFRRQEARIQQESDRKEQAQARAIEEEQARVRAEERIAALEAQLVMKRDEADTKGQLLHDILGNSEEARVAVTRNNDPQVYRCTIKKVRNDGEAHERGDTKMPAINELQEQTGTMVVTIPSSERSIRSAHSSISQISHSTRASVAVNRCMQEVACSLIRNDVSTAAICNATGYTPEQVAFLRREILPPGQVASSGPAVEESSPELTTPGEREDNTTTRTSHEGMRGSLTTVPDLEPEELAAAESIAFGNRSVMVPGDEADARSQDSTSRTIVPSINTDENE